MLKQTVSSKIKNLTKTVFDLNVSRFKKILLSTGFLVLGMCMTGQAVHAATMTKDDIWSQGGKTTVKVKVTKAAGDKCSFEGITIKAGGTEATILESKIDATELEWTGVLQLPDEESHILTATMPGTEQEAEPTIATMEENVGGVVANSPRVKEGTLLKYSSPEYGDYIQAQFIDDNCKITKITDVDKTERLVLEEKEQEKNVTLKYILNENEKTFRIWNEEDYSTVVDISDAVDIKFNARTRDGSRFVLGVSDTITKDNVGYTLDSIVTGAGQEIDYHSNDNMYGKIGTGGDGDNEDVDLEEIVGVTKLILTYKATEGDATIEVTLPLILDKTTPEVVGYVATEDPDGTFDVEKVKANIRKNVTKSNTEDASIKLRAYVNNTTDKCIVEVRDVQSGIDTIQLLKGADGAYKLIEDTAISEEQKSIAKKAGYNSHGKLMSSVLHLFSFEGLKDRVTAVRVTDGLGNKIDIPVEVSNVEKEDTIIYAQLEEYPDSNGRPAYRVVAQDYKAGLWKIERDTDDKNVKQVLVNFESPNADGIIVEKMQDGIPKPVESSEISDLLEIAGQPGVSMYEQYTLGRVVRNINKEGQPTIMVYDALGNARQVSFDDIAFYCYYATYNKEGSLAIDLKENRGVWKITTCIVSPEDAAREKEFMYEFTKKVNNQEVTVKEVPVDSNEPMYDGKVPSNGSEDEPGKEFFITVESNNIPEDYKSGSDNRPKYITADGKEVVPNNGLGNVKDYGEYFNTTPGNSPTGYASTEDNRPKYKTVENEYIIPQEGINEPKYNGEIPSATNEPKYKGLVPTDGTDGTIDNRPKYKGEIATDENEPKYNFGGDIGEVVPVDPSDEAEPKYENEVPGEGPAGNEPEEGTPEHEKWQAAKDAHNIWEAAQALEASERSEYDEAWEEHKKWKAAYEAYNDDNTGWLAIKNAHDEWQGVMDEYNKWQDVLADYNEWKAVLAEYEEWKVANEEHIKWQAAKDAHEKWEEESIIEYTLEVFREDHEPNRLVKTYQVPDGVVQKVTVYHEHGRDDLSNEITSVKRKNAAALQDVSELGSTEVLYTTKKDIEYKEGNTLVGVTVRASRGVKLVEYVDKTVVEFNKDLPKELFINCECVTPDEENNNFIATVIDSVGCELKIYSNEVTYSIYGEHAEPVLQIVTLDEAIIDHGPIDQP